MKMNKYPQDQKPQNEMRPALPANQEQNPAGFVPSPDEVARKAYFCYVNEGSRPGRDVQHWLQAEAQLIEERNLTRIHGYHNRT